MRQASVTVKMCVCESDNSCEFIHVYVLVCVYL